MLACVFVISAFISAFTPEAKADITASRTFLSPVADGYTYVYDYVYATAWNAYSGTLDTAANYICGGSFLDSWYGISRAFPFFDSSEIPDGANITEAILSLYVEGDYSTDDFNVTVQGTGTYPHYPPEAEDYYRGWYGTTSLGSRNTSDGLSLGAFWNITLNAAGIAQISKTGITRFCLRSQNDIDGIAPTDYEYVGFAARDKGEAYAAKLYVTYTITEAGGGTGVYHYYIYGPYQDDGTVFDGLVNIKLYPSYNETLEFTLEGDGVTPQYVNWNLEQQGVVMTWNISTTGNYTRVYYLTSDYVENIYVFVPDPDLPFYLYAFTINDLVGVTDGYLESRVYANGTTRVVERQPINTINAAPFYMEWSRKYDMRVVCTQGVLTVGAFTALAETNPNVMIPAGSFAATSYGLLVTVTAERLTSTSIRVNYSDSEVKTYWIKIWIKHRLSNGSYTTDYYEGYPFFYFNTSSSSYSLNWTYALSKTDYYVQVQSQRTNGVKDWSFYCPYTRNQTNLWEPLNQLGSGLPFEMQYLPAVLLIAAAILSFSFGYISAGAWITWVTVCVVFLFGWLPWTAGSAVVLGVGAVICSGVTIGEFKKGERNL